jgi:hypothetical protein
MQRTFETADLSQAMIMKALKDGTLKIVERGKYVVTWECDDD